jgi:hypothetical protein
MAESLKSRCYKGRCCKVDVVKVKGLPGGGLFDIGVYRFSDHAGSLFMSWGQTRLLADTTYLHLKTKLIKIEKDSRRSLRPSKNWLLTCCQSWTDPPPPYFPSGIFLWIPPSSCPSVDPLVFHWPIALSYCQGWTLLTISGSRWLLCSSFNRPITLCFSSAASSYPFLTLFPKNSVNTCPLVSK